MKTQHSNFPVRLKYANAKNSRQIADIEARCFLPEEAASPEKVLQRIQAYPNFFICAWYLGQIVGFINGPVSESRDLQDEMYEDTSLHNPVLGRHQMVLSLAVDPEFQHQKIGSQLIEAMCEKSKKQGHLDVVLTCKKELVDFYKQHGFVDEGISLSQHSGSIWHQMRKTLQP